MKYQYKPLLESIGQFGVALLSKNEVQLKDSLIGLGAEHYFSYFDLSFEYLYFKNPLKDPSWGYASSYYALYIVQNEATFTEERELDNLFAVFSEIGGLIEILVVGFGLLVIHTETFFYYQRLMKEMLIE